LKQPVGIATWVSPSNGATGVLGNTPLVFVLPAAILPMHFHLQIADDTGFTTNLLEFKSWQNTGGWQYFDGSVWQAFPDTGVDPMYAGNQARYIPLSLTEGLKYRRIRGRLNQIS
jgi:hypothetical protein